MFLVSDTQTIEDFFKKVNFIPPKGYDLSYFIAPQDDDSADLPDFDGYTQKPVQQGENTSEAPTTVVYKKKNEHLHADSVDMYKFYDQPSELPFNEALPPDARSVGKIPLESRTDRSIDFILREGAGFLPAGTLFHFTKMGRM